MGIKKRRGKNIRPPGPPNPVVPTGGPPRSRGKTWALRLACVVAAPLVCFAIIELLLRLVGFGYPTSFLLPGTRGNEPVFVQNNQFGWRFFGPQMSRVPAAIAIPQTKPAGTVRIFVFGESAAFGDPQSSFGLPRMLEAQLSLRHPGTKFEIVNAAMTGINSHAIVPIARDCAKAGGDIWVIYMGNNEVVGPFGAGTVFGPQSPPLPLIRASLALKATRTGEWLESIRARIEKPPASKSEWGGMEMFLGHQVRADDPQMQAVYHHFQRNLEDIISIGRSHGAGIVLSTVAVNLKDSAPFSSEHRAGLSEADAARWQQIYSRGVTAEEADNDSVAMAAFREAAQIDDRVAELAFREGATALRMGQADEARRDFTAAMNLDTLRFRCDTRMNELIRKTASDNPAVRLADASEAFAKASSDGLPGIDLFYEHVHLTFAGNYLLARTIADQIEKLLPGAQAAPSAAWPSLADCAARLAWSDWSQAGAISEILVRLSDPPFTLQINHDAQVRHWQDALRQLAPAMGAAGVKQALQVTESAVKKAPDDADLQEQLATLRSMTGNLATAETAARRATELLPSSSENWMGLGGILVKEQHFQEAAEAFRTAFSLDAENVWALQNLAQCLVKLDRKDDAMAEYRHALSIKPRFGLASLGLGELLEEMGRKAEANACYQQALANRIHRAGELATLARFCLSHSWYEAASTNYADAINLSPADPTLHFESGQSLSALGRHEEAAKRFAEAAELSPDWPQAQFLWGLELGRMGQPAEAAARFREAVRLMPGLLEARINLGIALMREGQAADALDEFNQVLQRSPTNAVAAGYVRAITERLSQQPPANPPAAK